MEKLTQEEFDAMTRDECGYINIPYDTDCTGVDFHGTGKIAFGSDCTLGSYCTLGNRCTLGNYCTLGDRCTLGEYCNVRAMFESGRVKNGLYVQVGNIGREHRTAYFYIDECGAMYVRAGCWFSGMDDFKERVHNVHGGTLYETQYMAACQYAETVLPLMLKADDERRARNAAGRGNTAWGDTAADVMHWWMEDGVLPGQMTMFGEDENG